VARAPRNSIPGSPGIYRRDTRDGKRYDIKLRGNIWVSGYPTLELARGERDRRNHEARHGRTLSTKPKTLATFVDEVWLPKAEAKIAQGSLQASTLEVDRSTLRCHILPAFGSLPITAIDLEAVERWQDSLCAAGQSNYSVRRIVTTLSGVLQLAQRYKHIPYNPVRDVEKPPARRMREPVSLNVADFHRLAESAPGLDEHRMILVAAFTGLRISELFGLRWSNVNLNTEGAETLLVLEQVYKGKRVDRPKTPSGARKVPLSPPAVTALRAQHIEGRPSADGLVFPSPNGRPWHASNFNRRAWDPIRKAAGLPGLRFHDLRHFYVSRVRDAGLSSVLSEQLVGHSDERTHRGYTQPIEGQDAVIRAALTDAFRPFSD
jgi:integrase